MSEKINGKDFVIGAVVGGVLGAMTALLLAPKSGRELRTDLSTHAHNVSDKTQQIAGTVAARTQTVAKNIHSGTNEIVGKVKNTAGNIVSDVKAWKETRKGEEQLEAEAETAVGEEE